ncbi:MAG TPA: vanadium-dependent haloperoxidase [Pedobacter sp.]
MTLAVLKSTRGNSPTYASRSLGYLGLTMYESIVHSASTHRSLGGQLDGLTLPAFEQGEYNWSLALSSGQSTLIKLLYPRANRNSIDSLFSHIELKVSNANSNVVNAKSIEWGNAVALAIYEWSTTDGGHGGHSTNFDFTFTVPVGPSYWSPAGFSQSLSSLPLHPHWGKNRTFISANKALAIPPMIPYSNNKTSDFYKIYKAVYDKNITLTMAEKETAAWWGDDPTETFSPPGHSYQLATIAIKKSKANLITAAEAYARTGMAVADAFINCWKAKYTYFNLRPSKYINANVALWQPYWPEPPFPAFPSGHATQSAAAATVMTAIFGEKFSFVDNTHKGHRRIDFEGTFSNLKYPARSFSSFWDAANECARSRFLGGIHTKYDNDIGQEEGTKIGTNVNSLMWRN